MASNVNTAVISGNLTRNAELRATQSGTPVTSFSLAFNDRDETNFFDCVAWKSTAEFVCQYLQKGSMVVVEGRLQTRDWKDQNGNKRKNTEIVVNRVHFCGSRENSGKASYDIPAPQPSGFTEIDELFGDPPFLGGE